MPIDECNANEPLKEEESDSVDPLDEIDEGESLPEGLESQDAGPPPPDPYDVTFFTEYGYTYEYVRRHTTLNPPVDVKQEITDNLLASDTLNVGSALKSGSGNTYIIGITTITNDRQSTTKDNGALVVEGGVGIEKNINIGGNGVITGTLTVNSDAQSNDKDSGALIVSLGGLGVEGNINAGGNGVVTGTLTVNSGAQSNDKDSGAVIVSNGGLGVEGNINAGGNLGVTGTVGINSTAPSTSSSSGALVVSGGIGIGGNVNAGGNLGVTGTSTLTGLLDANGGATIDNIRIGVAGDNTIDTATGTGNLIIDSAGGTTNINDNVTISGISTLTGLLDANGGAEIVNVRIGVTATNEIDTSTGSLTIDSAGGTTTIDDNLITNGNLTVNTGTITGTFANSISIGVSGTGLTGSGIYNNSGPTSITISSNATNANNPGTIVARDASGNFSAGTITATAFSGPLTGGVTGNASSASQILVTSDTISAEYKVPFTNTTSALQGNYSLYMDSESTFTYNPSLNRLTAGTFSGALSGNVTGNVTGSASNNLLKSGDTMTGDITWTIDGQGVAWLRVTDGASIKFYAGTNDTNNRLEFNTFDDNNEYFRWTHTPATPIGSIPYECMRLNPATGNNSVLTVTGSVTATTFNGSASSAGQISVTDTDSFAGPLLFVSSSGTGNKTVYLEDSFTYDSINNILSINGSITASAFNGAASALNTSNNYQMNSLGVGQASSGVTGNINCTTINAVGPKAFNIPHPQEENKRLRHSSIEGPRYDNIYRNTIRLINGKALIDLDIDCVSPGGQTMTPGTWEKLNRNPDFFLQNIEGWSRLRGKITGSILEIECEDPTSTDLISWMVIAERYDDGILMSDTSDDQGRMILEFDA